MVSPHTHSHKLSTMASYNQEVTYTSGGNTLTKTYAKNSKSSAERLLKAEVPGAVVVSIKTTPKV